MAGPILADRVKETTTTTGTGTLSLDGAATGFRTFVAGIGTTNTTIYAIKHQSAAEWEVGIGTVTDATPDTLSRTTVLSSSNSNALVSFSSGTKDVWCDNPAAFADKFLNPSDTFANLTAYQAGRLLLPNDGFGIYRDDGSNKYRLWGPTFPLNDPNEQTWAWINQGTATVTTTNGGIHLHEGTAEASAFQWRIRKKAVPSHPYTVTFGFMPEMYYAQYSIAGVLWRDNSGNFVCFNIRNDSGGLNFDLDKFTSPTAFSASYIGVTTAYPLFSGGCPLIFVRLEDNSTNRIVSVSRDGQNWIAVHSVSRTDFLTATEVGFGVSAFSQVSGMTLLHYKEG